MNKRLRPRACLGLPLGYVLIKTSRRISGTHSEWFRALAEAIAVGCASALMYGRREVFRMDSHRLGKTAELHRGFGKKSKGSVPRTFLV